MSVSPTRGLSDRPVTKDNVEFFVNQQLIPYLKDLKNILDSIELGDVTVSTLGDGAWTTLFTSADLGQDGTYAVHVIVLVISTGGTKHAVYDLTSIWKTESGVATQMGSTSGTTQETDALYDVRFSASSLQVLVEVRDDAISASNWVGRPSVVRLSL